MRSIMERNRQQLQERGEKLADLEQRTAQMQVSSGMAWHGMACDGCSNSSPLPSRSLPCLFSSLFWQSNWAI